MMMARLEMFPPHVLLVFVCLFVNNVALTSPQLKWSRGPSPPNLRSVPQTSFTCEGRTAGYYADPEAHCQAYHMCDTLEKQFSYLCPSYTLFNQKYMVCDHWHSVNCSSAASYYHLNTKIGQVPGKEPEDNSIVESKEIQSRSSKIKKKEKESKRRASNAIQSHKLSSIPKIKGKVNSRRPLFDKSSSKDVTPTRTTKATVLNSKSSLQRLFPPTLAPKVSPLDVDGRDRFPISARGSGLKVRFDKSEEDSIDELTTTSIKFRPLFVKSKKNFVDKRNFTISPDIFTTTPVTPSDFEDNFDEEKDIENKFQPRSFRVDELIAFLVPPVAETRTSRPPSLSSFLIPPLRGPVILKGDHQEIRTPLVVRKNNRRRPPISRASRVGLTLPQSLITPPRFSFSRPNPKFFIPSPGLLPPLPNNAISEEDDDDGSPGLSHHHKMTMTFPNATTVAIRRRPPLTVNPNCPRCHPAFLKPNKCHPCVIIK